MGAFLIAASIAVAQPSVTPPLTVGAGLTVSQQNVLSNSAPYSAAQAASDLAGTFSTPAQISATLSAYTPTSGVPALAPVQSVSGRTGAVVLATGDITGFASGAAAASPVQSVSGRTGAVTLTTTDVGGFTAGASAAAPIQTIAGRTGVVTLAPSDIVGFSTSAAAAAPVQSVAGRTGAVVLSASDISGLAAAVVANAPVTSVNGLTGIVTGLASSTGVTNGSNAAAGQIGEFMTSTVASGSAISLTTSMGANVTSLSLTAGDWECRGVVDFPLTAVTASLFQAGISQTSATVGPQDSFVTLPLLTTLLTNTLGVMVPVTRVSISATTAVYLVAESTFSLGTAKAYGTLSCRRIR